MAYLAAYQHPAFDQSGPTGPGWELVETDSAGRSIWGALIYRHRETGAERVCPAVWYNLPPARYAESLRWSADRTDATAARKADEGKPWSEAEAERWRRQARRLRAMAALCDRSDAPTAGGVDFLDDPTRSSKDEDSAIARALA